MTGALSPGMDPLHRVSQRATAWTRVNIAEGIPGVSTPLNWSLWEDANERMILGAYFDLGVLDRIEIPPPEAVDERTSAIFYGRPALNVDVSRRMADLQPGTSGNALEEYYFGAVRPDAQSRPSRRRYPAIARKLPAQWRSLPGRLDALHRELQGWWSALLAGDQLRSEAGARAALGRTRVLFDAVARPHSALALLCGALTQQTTAMAQAAGRAERVLDVLGGYHSLELDSIAELLEVHRGSRSLEAFLSEHGYQGPMQGEISSVPWRQDPAPLRALVESLGAARTDPTAMARERAAARERACREILAGLGPLRGRLTRWLFAEGARMLPSREVGKAAMMIGLDAARACARALGSHFAAAGQLEDAEDVFYLTLAEIDHGAAGDWAERVAVRRSQRREYEALELPESWLGNPEAKRRQAEAGSAVAPLEGRARGSLSGLGVSPGVAEGPVRVVADGASELQPGEILVCETTDPSYAGYFFVAAGVVTDIGGAMGHGSIVAREVGIPCVVNTREATRRLRTGDRVRIDGTTGAVDVLANSP